LNFPGPQEQSINVGAEDEDGEMLVDGLLDGAEDGATRGIWEGAEDKDGIWEGSEVGLLEVVGFWVGIEDEVGSLNKHGELNPLS